MMNVLLTGGAGYIGSKTTSLLIAAGLRVTVLDALVYGGESLLGVLDHPRFRLAKGSVLDAALVREAMTGCDAVVHMAAVVGEPACRVDEAAAQAINFDGTINVARIASELGAGRFIFLSTCSNYGVSAPGTMVDEDAPLNPLSQYARSKVEAEKWLLAQPGAMTTLVLRLGTICGLSPRMRFDLLVSEMARSAALGEPISIFTPEAWRPMLHVRDAARAILHCLQSRLPAGLRRVYNVVGENYQKQGFVDLVRRHYPDARITIQQGHTDPRDYRADGRRIVEELGFQTESTVEQAFVETAEAVAHGVFRDPHWPGHSAIPDPRRLHELLIPTKHAA